MKKNYLFIFFLFSTLSFSQSKALSEVLEKVYLLEKTENYYEAKQLFKKVEKQNKITLSEKQFVVAYLNFYDFLISAETKNLDNAFKIAQNWQNRKPYQTELLLNLYTAKTHDIANKGGWSESLDFALKGYKIPDFDQAKLETKSDYLYELGSIYRECKNPYKAILFFEKSLELKIKDKGENHPEIAVQFNALGDANVENYNPTKANEYYKKAINILEKINKNKPDEVDELLTAYRNLTRSLLEYGAQDEARITNEKCNALFLKNKKKLKETSQETYYHARQRQVASNVAYYSASGNFVKATQYCDSLKTETPFNNENIKAIEFLTFRYFDIVDFLYEFEDYAQTISKAHQLEKIIDQYDFVVPKMLVNAKLGTSYEKLKDYKKALYHIQIAEQIIDQQNFTSSKFSIQIIKAVILSGMNKNQSAIDISKQTVEQLVFEKTKIKTNIETIKYENLASLADHYFINIFQKVAGLYLKQYQKNHQQKDLQIAENLFQIAAKLFRDYYLKGEYNDYLSYYHNEIVQGLIECTLLQKSDFSQKLVNLNLIEQNASQHLLKEFDKKVKRKSSSISNYLNKIKELKAELVFYQNQKPEQKNQKFLNEKQIKILQNNIALLTKKINETEKNYTKFNANNFDLNEVINHLKNEEQLLKYYVGNNTIYATILTQNSIEIKKIGDRKFIENQVKNYLKQTQKLQSNSKKNAANLYSVLMPFQLKKKITVIPDNFLNYLPFETLINPKDGKYLVQNHNVSYDYSLPMWLLHYQNKEEHHKQSLAVFSPFYDQKSGENRSDFKNLKFANIESQKIASLFDGDLFAKEKATKNNFIKEKENFDIFHLSMHSQLFEDDFNKSCLLFSNDERLYFSELYGMNIPASMVVLSACDTGNGILKNGEGIMSMSRALTYAGVQSAVVSLWQVPDKETSELMISFYENLKKGQAKDEALANAKNAFIKNNPMKKQPYYWAGFIVNGDISAIADKGYPWMIYVGLAFILLLIFVFRKKLLQLRK